jgi:hypothetical protein
MKVERIRYGVKREGDVMQAHNEDLNLDSYSSGRHVFSCAKLSCTYFSLSFMLIGSLRHFVAVASAYCDHTRTIILDGAQLAQEIT